MRKDVVEIAHADMSPVLRALIAYESNGALILVSPQPLIAEMLQRSPDVRWGQGLGFFTMADAVAGCRKIDLVSLDPATNSNFGMGSAEALIPLHLDGPRHVFYRKLLAPLLTARRMARLQPSIRSLADELIDRFVSDDSVELHDAFCVPLPSAIFLELFGLPLEDAAFLVEAKDQILNNDGTTREEKEENGRVVGRRLRERLRVRLAERLAESCRRIVAHPEVLPDAVEELLRFETPVPSSGACWAARDTEINGVPVRKHDVVYFCWAGANLDPAAFDRPLTPDLERKRHSHVGFASDIHRCLGSHVARVQLRTAIDQLHRRLPDDQIRAGEEPAYEFGGVRRAKYLPIEFRASEA